MRAWAQRKYCQHNQAIPTWLLLAAAGLACMLALAGCASTPRPPSPSAYDTIIHSAPGERAGGVGLNTPITVRFNRPIVSDSAVADAASNPDATARLPQPITLVASDNTDTLIEGSGSWITPEMFSFYPHQGLQPSTHYTATVRSDATEYGEVRLEEPHTWGFSTESRVLVGTRPFNGAIEVAPDTTIEVYLTDSVDRESASQQFTLTPTNRDEAIAGAVRLLDDAENHGFVFTPEQPLQAGVSYRASLPPGIRNRSGGVMTTQALTWQFTVLHSLDVSSVEPSSGEQGVATDTHLRVRFTRPVVALATIANQQGMPHPLEITPPVPGIGQWVDPNTYVYSPTTRLEDETTYTVTVKGGQRDQAGSSMPHDYTWTFDVSDEASALNAPETINPQRIYISSKVGPQGPVAVDFQMNMDPASIQDRLSIEDASGQPISGTMTVIGEYVYFSPHAPLQRGAEYTLHVEQGASAQHIAAVLAEPYRKQFRVYPLPELVGVEPGRGMDEFIPGSVAYGGSGLRIEFNARMDWESVLANMVIEPQPARIFTSTGQTILLVDPELKPDTDYRITIGAEARDVYGVALGEAQVATFHTQPAENTQQVELVTNFAPHATGDYVHMPPYKASRMSFSDGRVFGTYSAYEPVRISLRHTSVQRITSRLYQLEPSRVIALMEGWNDTWYNFHPDPSTLLNETQQPLYSVPGQEWLDVLNLGTLEPGLYLLVVQSDEGIADHQVLVVSPYAMTIKRSASQLFVWVVDLATGDPVEGLPLNISFSSPTGQEAVVPVATDTPIPTNTPTPTISGTAVAQPTPAATYSYPVQPFVTGITSASPGQTNSDGVVELSPLDIQLDAALDDPLYVWSPQGHQFAFATTTWDRGITRSSFNMPVGTVESEVVGNVYTDRPMYRPGQEVAIRGTARIDTDRLYHLPSPGKRVEVTVVDAAGTTILSEKVPLNGTGSFSTSMNLDPFAQNGTYGIFCNLEGEEVPTNSSSSISGNYDGIPFPAHHFYGSFLVTEYRKPTFDIQVTPENIRLLPDQTAVISVSARYFSGEPVANVPVRWHVIEEPLRFTSEHADNFTFGEDEDAQQRFGSRKSIMMEQGTTDSRGRALIRLDGSKLHRDSEHHRLVLNVEITDINGQVVNVAHSFIESHASEFSIGLRPEHHLLRAGEAQQIDVVLLDPWEQPVAHHPLDINVLQRTWVTAREQGSDGRFYWTSTYSDTLVKSRTITTTRQGRARVTLDHSEGGQYFIQAVSRDSNGNTTQSKIPVAVYDDSRDTFWGIENTNRIDLVADQDTYQPGDTAHILVPAPYRGSTALVTVERSEVIKHQIVQIAGTTGMLDIPIKPEYTPNIYVSVVLIHPASEDTPIPELRVGTINLNVPIEEQLLHIDVQATPATPAGPGDEVTFDISVTDVAGHAVQAELTLAMVDDALLSLVDNPTPTYTDRFFPQRPLGVATANTLVQLVDRVTLRVLPGSKGGSGGPSVYGNYMGLKSDVPLRTNFPDTAYWNPSLMTDEQGNASVTVVLPDNATTWRMTVRALTPNTRFGQASRAVTVTRPLLIQPFPPTSLIVGDRVTLQAPVWNNTAQTISATATLEAQGLHLLSDAHQHLSLQPGEQAVVAWDVEARTAGNAVLTFVVQGGGLADGVQRTVTVRRYALPEHVVSRGMVRDTTTTPVTIPDPPPHTEQSEAYVYLTPSLAAAVNGGLHELAEHPPASTEQMVSYTLPHLAALQTNHPYLDTAEQRSMLASTLPTHLQRIYRLQNIDGGWGWWREDDISHPYLTAYVVEGLMAAQRAGYHIDQRVFDQAIEYLETTLNTRELAIDAFDSWRATARSYVLFVLMESGHIDFGRTIALYEQRDNLALYGRAYLLMTLDTLGGQDERIQTLTDELAAVAIPRNGTVYWAEPEEHPATMSSNVRTTALMLRALLRTNPQHALVPNAARYLLHQREGYGWSTTQDTALSLVALAAYQEHLAQHGQESERETGYTVALDDTTLLEQSPTQSQETPAATGMPTMPLTAVVNLSPAEARQEHTLSIQQTLPNQDGSSAEGWLHYAMLVQHYPPVDTIEARDDGFKIERTYLPIDPETFLPGSKAVQEARLSDLVMVHFTLTVPEQAHYLVIQDHLPAGLVPVEITPQSANIIVQPPPADPSVPAQDIPYLTHVEFAADQVSLFASHLPRGTYEYSYLARASHRGTFQAPPAHVYQVYQPAISGRSTGELFLVQ